MSLKDVWQQKSDRQLEIAARELEHYENPAQQAILLEIHKRGLNKVRSSTEISLNKKGLHKPVYANYWSRFTAAVIDRAISIIIFIVVISLLMFVLDVLKIQIANDNWIFPTFLVIDWLYNGILESSTKQATIGKKLLGIKVTDLNGKRISFGQGSVRYLGKFFCAVLFIFNKFKIVAFNNQRQSIQDIMANTLVVKKSKQRKTKVNCTKQNKKDYSQKKSLPDNIWMNRQNEQNALIKYWQENNIPYQLRENEIQFGVITLKVSDDKNSIVELGQQLRSWKADNQEVKRILGIERMLKGERPKVATSLFMVPHIPSMPETCHENVALILTSKSADEKELATSLTNLVEKSNIARILSYRLYCDMNR